MHPLAEAIIIWSFAVAMVIGVVWLGVFTWRVGVAPAVLDVVDALEERDLKCCEEKLRKERRVLDSLIKDRNEWREKYYAAKRQ